MAKNKKKNAALIVLSLVVAFLIVESLLRFLGWGFHYLQERKNIESTLSLTKQLDKNIDRQLHWWAKREVIILCIGESTTGLGGENSWPRHLQRILNSIQDQRSFRVINTGVPGTQTHEISSMLPRYLNKYSPDIVLAMVGLNDYCNRPGSPYCNNSFFSPGPNPTKTTLREFQLTRWLGKLRAYHLVTWVTGGIKARVKGEAEGMTIPNVVGGRGGEGTFLVYNLVHSNVTHLHPKTIRNLNDMVNLTTDQGIEFIFVQYALRKTHILKNVVENKNVFYISNYERFVDLLEQYDYDDLFTDTFAEDFGHATTFGNRNIADNVARQLLERLELQEQSN